jgi:hypothetical protein
MHQEKMLKEIEAGKTKKAETLVVNVQIIIN